MKYSVLFAGLSLATLTATAQNVGIGTNTPTRAKLEVHGVGAGTSHTSVLLGGDGVGVSFQRGVPAIGYNQYRGQATGFGKFIADGYAGFQTFYPQVWAMTYELMGKGLAEQTTATTKKPLAIDYFGHTIINRSGVIGFDAALTVGRGNYDATACFFGTTHNSFFNLGAAENTYIRAGKDGGRVIINDIYGGMIHLHGSTGINTATPAVPLEIRQVDNMGVALVNSTTFTNWEFNVDVNTGNLRLMAGGAYVGGFKSSNGSYVAVSDARLKKSVEELPSIMERYMKLQPVTYNMINDLSQKTRIGFIAQDVKKLFPELVSLQRDSTPGYPDIDNLHSLSYESVPVLTVKVIQEQQDLIQQQEQLIQQLHTKLAVLRRKLKDSEEKN